MGSKHTELIARGLILDGGRVLACKDTRGDYFYLPGGHIEFGESAADALAREIDEEAGLKAKVGRLLMVFEQAFEQKGKPHHELCLMFHVEHLADPDQPVDPSRAPTLPEVRSREEKLDFEWIELAALPETDLRPIEIKAWLVVGGGDAEGVLWISGFD